LALFWSFNTTDEQLLAARQTRTYLAEITTDRASVNVTTL